MRWHTSTPRDRAGTKPLGMPESLARRRLPWGCGDPANSASGIACEYNLSSMFVVLDSHNPKSPQKVAVLKFVPSRQAIGHAAQRGDRQTLGPLHQESRRLAA